MIGMYVITLPFAPEVFAYWHTPWRDERFEGVKTVTAEQNLGRRWPIARPWQLERWKKKLGRRGPLYRFIRHRVCVAMFVALPVVGCTSKEHQES